MTRVDGWTEDPVRDRVSGPYPPPRSDAGRWTVRLTTRDGDITITAPNAISTEAMREAMRAYWGEKT